jgi:NADPH-dependent curcumin reductase CurA
MANVNREIHLKSRPTGMPTAANFELVETPRPAAGAVSRAQRVDVGRSVHARADDGPRNLAYVIGKSIKMQGFIVTDFLDMAPQFFADMGAWIRAGKITWQETVVDGIDKAPQAFLGPFTGENLGKMLVHLGPDRA